MEFDQFGRPIRSITYDVAQDSGESVGIPQQPNVERDFAPRQTSVVSQPHPPSIPQIPPANEARDNTPQWKKRLEYVAAGIGIGLLIVNFFQLRATKKSADAARSAADTATQALRAGAEQFRTDERAWIQIDSIKKTIIPPSATFPTLSFRYEVFLKNVGKTIAKNAKLRRISSLGGYPDEKMVEMTLKHFLVPEATQVPFYPIPRAFAPNTVLPIPFTLGGTVPTSNNTLYSTSMGRIDYTDDFNIPHWMTFCLVVWNVAGDLQYCEYGNDQDRNPETPSPKR